MKRIRLDLLLLITYVVIIGIIGTIGKYFTQDGGDSSLDQTRTAPEFIAWNITLLAYAILIFVTFHLINLRLLSNEDEQDRRIKIRNRTYVIILPMLPLGIGTALMLLI